MSQVKSYQDLTVWQKAMDLVEESYRLSRNFPQTENYGLTSQIRRASISIPANIAKGKGRMHLGDYLRHLSIANGSWMELETHWLIAIRLEYINNEQLKTFWQLTGETGRMLNKLMQKLESLKK
ncbi:MAG: four helix bundle protein [Microcystaceae cyanobacterium]